MPNKTKAVQSTQTGVLLPANHLRYASDRFQERIAPIIYQLTLKTTDQQVWNLVVSILHTLGFNEHQWSVHEERLAKSLKMFNEDKGTIDRVGGLFKRLKLSKCQVSIDVLKPDDWAAKWKKGWKPAALTECIDVVPLWHKDSYRPKKGRKVIYMDTLMSFGTGLHETTRMMAQYIEEYHDEPKSFLDIGTGTGVLSLVAYLWGIKNIVALDIGELSVEAAKSNSVLNDMPFKVYLRDISKYQSKTQYDFVAANLITHDLIRCRENIIACVKPGGLLAMSGISRDNWDNFKRAFLKKPLKVLESRQGDAWVSVICRRS